ncbi:aspartic peptidase domain-containing protein [Tricladium varicosporioides]|nr:aspartic peptidase domain-containing protein [Hymenoscyphus varicosporioides]
MKIHRRGSPNPAPFSFTPTGQWEGNDGNWSTFGIRVGTPAQSFRVQISTTSGETWVPSIDSPGACTPSDPANCTTLRGILSNQTAGFSTGNSSSWILGDIYGLQLEDNLNYTGNGNYGFDTVGIGFTDNTAAPSLIHQVVAGIVTKKFMFGVFGVRPRETAFVDATRPQPSFLSSLRNQTLIPSLSYGYSAGASYRNSALASLTLGGYDASLFTPNNINFTLNANATREMIVGVQTILGENTLAGTASLLPKGIKASLDSTIPELWLPSEACSIFERSFGLIFDNRTERYLVNDTAHAKLLQLNPSITFKIGVNSTGGNTINLNFPYTAFDLQASYPIYPNRTNYFPLRRAFNESQYTLGRTFFQEAYLIADYERNQFSISSRVFNNAAQPNLIAILPVEETKTLVPDSASPLSIGAIIGIAIGGFIFLLLAAFGMWKFYKYQQKKRPGFVKKTTDVPKEDEEVVAPRVRGDPNAVEMPSGEKYRGLPYENFKFIKPPEMDAGMVPEMGGKMLRAELPADSVYNSKR